MNDPIVEWLQKNGYPVTRENYLDVAYPNGLPEDYGHELESELPEWLQDFDEVM